MEDQAYTKRELDHFFVELDKRLDHQDAMLSEIKMQTMKTNGRVTKLEFWISALKWTCGTVWTLILIIIPLLWHEEQLQSMHDAYIAAKTVLAEQQKANQ